MDDLVISLDVCKLKKFVKFKNSTIKKPWGFYFKFNPIANQPGKVIAFKLITDEELQLLSGKKFESIIDIFSSYDVIFDDIISNNTVDDDSTKYERKCHLFFPHIRNIITPNLKCQVFFDYRDRGDLENNSCEIVYKDHDSAIVPFIVAPYSDITFKFVFKYYGCDFFCKKITIPSNAVWFTKHAKNNLIKSNKHIKINNEDTY